MQKNHLTRYSFFIYVFVFFFCFYEVSQSSEYSDQELASCSVDDFISIVNDDSQWTLNAIDDPRVKTKIRYAVEILGGIRSQRAVPSLVRRINTNTNRFGGLPRFKDAFVVAALLRIGDCSDICAFFESENLISNFPFYFYCFYDFVMPTESMINYLDFYLEKNQKDISSSKKEKILRLKESLLISSTSRYNIYYYKNLPPLSDFVLNHPLYKTRQAEIKTNLEVLQKKKKITELDLELLSAVFKLGEMRAEEAIKVLVPNLLLKPDSSIKSQERTIDTKYVAIKDYPVAVALAEIGIPSIWGLLNEIAANHHDEQYYQTAYQTMTAILPAVAIPGFVNELLKTKQDEMSQLRLYKMYPLMDNFRFKVNNLKSFSSKNDLDDLKRSLNEFESCLNKNDEFILWMNSALWAINKGQKEADIPYNKTEKNSYTDLIRQTILKIFECKPKSSLALLTQLQLADPYRNYVSWAKLKNESEDDFMIFRKNITERIVLLFQEAYLVHEQLKKERENAEKAFAQLRKNKDNKENFIIDQTNIKEFNEWERLSQKIKENRELYIGFNDIVENSDKLIECLVDLYTSKPYNSNELLELLRSNAVNSIFMQKVIDAIPNTILDSLYIPGFRNWESTDGLFKTTAKFIALEKDNVVLEKSDGKRTTIGLNVLRKTDQDYVKTILGTETKNDNENQNNPK